MATATVAVVYTTQRKKKLKRIVCKRRKSEGIEMRAPGSQPVRAHKQKIFSKRNKKKWISPGFVHEKCHELITYRLHRSGVIIWFLRYATCSVSVASLPQLNSFVLFDVVKWLAALKAHNVSVDERRTLLPTHFQSPNKLCYIRDWQLG